MYRRPMLLKAALFHWIVGITVNNYKEPKSYISSINPRVPQVLKNTSLKLYHFLSRRALIMVFIYKVEYSGTKNYSALIFGIGIDVSYSILLGQSVICELLVCYGYVIYM